MSVTATAWAVYLGANTPSRLANEWRISGQKAYSHLLKAEQAGTIRKIAAARYEQNEYYIDPFDA